MLKAKLYFRQKSQPTRIKACAGDWLAYGIQRKPVFFTTEQCVPYVETMEIDRFWYESGLWTAGVCECYSLTLGVGVRRVYGRDVGSD